MKPLNLVATTPCITLAKRSLIESKFHVYGENWSSKAARRSVKPLLLDQSLMVQTLSGDDEGQ
ncbi:MAG: hypothetical protein AAF456_03090 [Planctomycetota bacterium]